MYFSFKLDIYNEKLNKQCCSRIYDFFHLYGRFNIPDSGVEESRAEIVDSADNLSSTQLKCSSLHKSAFIIELYASCDVSAVIASNFLEQSNVF